MFEAISIYLNYDRVKYIKPEKAGERAADMIALKVLGQQARQEMIAFCQQLETQIAPWRMQSVSNWANQAQLTRPHFWCYFKMPEDKADDVGIALRLYGDGKEFGLSLEVSFVERKKSDKTVTKQNRVLALPIKPPCYYWAQIDGSSHYFEGIETNRQYLQTAVLSGEVRKVLVKYDISAIAKMSSSQLISRVKQGLQELIPYYEKTKRDESFGF
ncbi:hypothetical protein [Streptococcus plurextorum]|uniref:hypothetical protein n=1 Tax=Streptococcus plurextorum TaxID=456876 RepID=UPI0003FEF66B|nr:hypothetical protein [Streptococcus plurextorum]